ncbi:MAG: sugar transferase [Gammaproteobacteria bacterium]|nr:sugar transferase [Gammaproteobacteria bacterium]
MLLIDLILVSVATLSALFLRHDLAVSEDRLIAFLPYLAYSLGIGLLAITGYGLHRSIWRLSGSRDYWRIVTVALVTVLGATALGFLVDRLEGVPRAVPLIQLGTMAALMLAARVLTRKRGELRARRRALALVPETRQETRATVLIVGLNSVTELYLQAIAELTEGRVEVAGILGRSARQVGRLAQSHRVLGLPEDLTSVLRNLEVEGIFVDRIVVALPLHKLSDAARDALLDVQQDTSITVQILADSVHPSGDVGETTERGGDLRALEFTAAELDLVRGRSYFAAKRAFDIVGAAVLMAVAAPIVALATLLVAIDVGVPIVFCQRRPGRWGRPVRVYKFRTMRGAYARDGRRLGDAERCSWIGRILRRSRLDELPQLYNVLVGDMSFVGPRPLLPVDQSPEFKARLLVRPGITGYAQVEGGRDVAPADKAAMDVWYVQNASLALDLQVLLRTVPMMLFGDRINPSAIERAWCDLHPTGICRTWRRPVRAGADSALDGQSGLASGRRAA